MRRMRCSNYGKDFTRAASLQLVTNETRTEAPRENQESTELRFHAKQRGMTSLPSTAPPSFPQARVMEVPLSDADVTLEESEAPVSEQDEAYERDGNAQGSRFPGNQVPHLNRPYTFSERTPSRRSRESNLSKRRRILAGQRCAFLDNGWVCCERRRCVFGFDKELIQSRRSTYLGMKYFQRKTILSSMLQPDGTFRFEGSPVCQKFIIQVLSFSNSVIAAVKQLPHARASASAHRMQRDGLSDSAKFDVLLFLRRLSESCGDSMPDSSEVHLPYHVKADVYKLFLEDLARPESALLCRRVSESYFYWIWKKGAPHIKTRKLHRFTKCAECEFYRAELARAGLDLSKSGKLKQAKSVHVQYVMRERLEYAAKRDASKRNPEQYCSFIVDGADQSAYGLPHLIFNTKAMRGEKLKVRLIGIKEHLPIPNVFFYLMTEEFETGANHVVEAVHRFLTQKREQGPIPPTLFVQADNCWRENKNKYFMSYFEMLVALGVVVKVYVSFLPVGHTHEDIDQIFSRTAVHLRSHNAVTIEDLREELSVSYTPRPKVSRISAVANFSGLCEAAHCIRNPPAWTQFHYFHFYREAGAPSVPHQKFCTNLSVRIDSTSDWKSFHGSQGFLKFVPDLLQTPSTVLSSPQNYDAVVRAIETAETLINNHAKMESLRALAKEVYSDREQKFHWNKRTMIELHGQYISSFVKQSNVSQESPSTCELCFEYSYERGDMVAARPVKAVDLFWLAQVEKVLKNDRGVPERLNVRWFEQYGSQTDDPFEATYLPAFIVSDANRKKIKVPWIDDISVSTILVTFGSLSRKHKINSYTAKKIRDALKA